MATWAAYRQLRGPLNLGMRLEYLVAMSDYRYHLSQGGKLKFEQFVRYHNSPEPETSLEAIAKKIGVPYEIRLNKQSTGA